MTPSDPREPVEGYERFFGFREAPFSLAPNPRFLFESASHAAALAQVAYALERREPLVVITGEIGTGKTLLCRTVVHRMERKTFVSVINDPLLDRDDLLKQLLEDFGVISKDRTRLGPATRHDLIHALEDFLASLAPLQAHAVVIIDEAQHLQPDVLEQIRLLSNIDDERGTMLQIILVGQTDLEPLLSRPELRQFQQRVSRRYRLEALSADELKQYIDHRLQVARRGAPGRRAMPGATELKAAIAEWDGRRDEQALEAPFAPEVIFTADAIQAIWKLSGGLPRVVNILCDRALEAAWERRQRTIDVPMITAAALALNLAAPHAPLGAWAPAGAAPEAVPLERPAPHVFGTATPVRTPRRANRMLIGAASAAAVIATIWLGALALNRPPETPPQAAPATGQPGPAAPSASGAGAQSGTSSSISQTPPDAPPAAASAPPPGDPATPAADSSQLRGTQPAGAVSTAAGERFEIVVASFRTEGRANAVANQVTTLDLPVRQRVASGWQQVLAGPFASRAEAEQAQGRLDRAGLTGTQIVPAPR